jgi:SET domain-containing protein
MLVIKAVGKPVSHGMGLFAEEFIPKGTDIWRFKDGVDKAYSPEEAHKLSEPERSTVLNLFHSYVSKQTGRYIVPGDQAVYINHSDTPNIGVRYERDVEEDVNFALRDIEVGEELTLNYRDFAEEGVDF